MKLMNLVTLPFTAVLDACTLGNIGGDRSFTQQVFDRDARERENEQLIDALKVALRERK